MNEEKREQQRVTFEDVENSLTKDSEGNLLDEPISPFDTNAAKVRITIGYGGNNTIQKHLNTLRDNINKELLKELPAESAVPAAPKDIVNSLWEAAWKSVQALTSSRIERLTVERDGLQLKSGSQLNDINNLSLQVDDLEEIVFNKDKNIDEIKVEYQQKVDEIKSESQQEVDEIKSESDELKDNLEKVTKKLESSRLETEQIRKDLAHQKEISVRDIEIERVSLQSVINHLNDQVSELKAMRIASSK